MQVARISAITHGNPRTFLLSPGHALTLGRSSRCSVPLRDRKVSRVHCQLTFDQGHVVATDLDSRHGLQHLGERKTILAMQTGDGFHIGETFVRFVGFEEADDATVASWFEPGGMYAQRIDADDDAEGEDDADEAAAGPVPGDAFAAAPVQPQQAQPPTDTAWAAGGTVGGMTPAYGADQYADVARDVMRAEPLRRRPASANKALAARLAAESIVFSIHMALCIVLLLALRAGVGFDLYRIFGFAAN